MITKEMITFGIEKQVVKFVIDPNIGSGTVCKIGNCWFYFGGLEAEEMNPDEYISNVPMTNIVNEIFEVLQDFKSDDNFRDEYDYYESVLSGKNTTGATIHNMIKVKFDNLLKN